MAAFALETWSNVLVRLDVEDLRNCCLVCRYVSQIAQKIMLYDLYYNEEQPQAGNVKNIHAFMHTLCSRLDWTTHLEKLNLHIVDPRVVELLLLMLGDGTFNLRIFNVYMVITARQKYDSYDHNSQMCPIKNSSTLRSLSFIGPHSMVKYISCILPTAMKLQHLRLMNISVNPLELDVAVVKVIRNLESLEMQNISGQVTTIMIKQNEISLRRLHLEQCTIEASSLRLLPNLRDLHVDEQCDAILATAVTLLSLSIFEDHQPLHYLSKYSSSCQSITDLYLVENMCMDFRNIQESLVESFRLQLLPALVTIEIGTWETLESLLPFLPLTTRLINFHESEFKYCPFILASIPYLVPRSRSATLAIHIHVEDAYQSFLSIASHLKADFPQFLTCRIFYEDTYIWGSLEARSVEL